MSSRTPAARRIFQPATFNKIELKTDGRPRTRSLPIPVTRLIDEFVPSIRTELTGYGRNRQKYFVEVGEFVDCVSKIYVGFVTLNGIGLDAFSK